MTRFTIGATTIDRIEESAGLGFKANVLLPDWTPEAVEKHRAWLVPHHFVEARQRLVLSVHSWLIRTTHYNILVDTCGGDDKERPDFQAFHQKKTGYLDKLAAVGLRPEDIHYVLCTHLHIDHVGWNTRLKDGRWVPTFPNARYLYGRKDLALYDGTLQLTDERRQVYADSVLPVIEAGQVDFVDGETSLGDKLFISPAPGHTPGHVLIRLEDGGQEALFSGDIMHHPIQVFEPDWNSAFCVDPHAARATRRRVLERCVSHGGLLCPAHFGAPHAGHVTAKGGSFRFDMG